MRKIKKKLQKITFIDSKTKTKTKTNKNQTNKKSKYQDLNESW